MTAVMFSLTLFGSGALAGTCLRSAVREGRSQRRWFFVLLAAVALWVSAWTILATVRY